MARGGRRAPVVGGGGRRGYGSRFIPGRTGNITEGWRSVVAQLWSRMNAEQKQSMKQVIESSDVDHNRAIWMMDDMAGSDTDWTDPGKMGKLGPLHEAASLERIDTCKYLVEDLGFDINAEANNDSRISPLACAVLRGKAIVVRYLLDKGADPDKEDVIGFTPLHYAIKEGNDGLVRLLLLKGASVNASSSEGAPLHVAASLGKSTIVQILLQNNADPNKVCADIGTPMTATILCTTAVCVTPEKISESAALKCMKFLFKAGADLNCANPDTPLVIATSKHLCECVKYFLEVGADANIPINHGGTTPIEIAAGSGRTDLVEILFPYTSPIQSVSNWSVEGIIAHANSGYSNGKDSSWEKLTEAFEMFVKPPYLPLPPAHHLSPHYRPVPPADLVPTLPLLHDPSMSPYYLPVTPAEHLAPLYKPMRVTFPKPAPTVLLQPCSQKDLKLPMQQGKEDESQGRE